MSEGKLSEDQETKDQINPIFEIRISGEQTSDANSSFDNPSGSSSDQATSLLNDSTRHVQNNDHTINVGTFYWFKV